MLEVVFVRFFLVSNSSFPPSHSVLSLSMCGLNLRGRYFMLRLFEGQNSFVWEMCLFSPVCLFYVYIYLKSLIYLVKLLLYFGVLLIDNVGLVSRVQQSDSLIHVHASFFFEFFHRLGYSSVLRVPCARW